MIPAEYVAALATETSWRVESPYTQKRVPCVL